jgi:hypothetical protein
MYKRHIPGIIGRNNLEKKITYPCYISVKYPLLLLFLNAIEIDYEDFWNKIDDLNIQMSGNYIITDNFDEKLPHYHLDESPYCENLNMILDEKYDLIENYTQSQKDIPKTLIDDINIKNPQNVVVYIIDGLSYEDFITVNPLGYSKKCTPLFVNGETSTGNGITNIIYGKNNIPISKKLHDVGYAPYGLTYWTRTQNGPTDIFFKYFENENMFSDFECLKDFIMDNTSKKRYFQIYRMGLDEDAHKLRVVNSKSIENKINNIFSNVKDLESCFKKKGESYLIYILSDHGILWNFDKKYAKGSHKGISYFECFVPFIKLEG